MFTFTLTLCKWTHKEADIATFSREHTRNRKEIKMVLCITNMWKDEEQHISDPAIKWVCVSPCVIQGKICDVMWTGIFHFFCLQLILIHKKSKYQYIWIWFPLYGTYVLQKSFSTVNIWLQSNKNTELVCEKACDFLHIICWNVIVWQQTICITLRTWFNALNY
jgi:hypothetical protein